MPSITVTPGQRVRRNLILKWIMTLLVMALLGIVGIAIYTANARTQELKSAASALYESMLNKSRLEDSTPNVTPYCLDQLRIALREKGRLEHHEVRRTWPLPRGFGTTVVVDTRRTSEEYEESIATFGLKLYDHRIDPPPP